MYFIMETLGNTQLLSQGTIQQQLIQVNEMVETWADS